MAVNVEVGTFNANTGGTTTTVTTGFQGTAVIFWTWGKTSTGESTIASFNFGFSDGTNLRGAGWAGDDAVGTTNVGKNLDTLGAGSPLTNGNPTLGTGGRITGVAFNATPNMVVTFTSTPASAWKWNYILLGGADITNVKVGSITAATGTGDQTTTGVGFQPDAVFFIGTNLTSGAANAQAYTNIGFARADADGTSNIAQWTKWIHVTDAVSTSGQVDGQSEVRNDACLSGSISGSGTDFVAALTSFNSDGWVINYSNAAASAWLEFYLAIKGGKWAAGTSTKPATATTQNVTGLAYAPKLLAMLMSSPTATGTITSEAISTFGATDGTNEVYGGSYHNDAINTVAKSGGSATALLHEMNATANATITELGSDGSWTITWDASGTAYLTPWFTVGDTLAGGGGDPTMGDYAGEFKILRPAYW